MLSCTKCFTVFAPGATPVCPHCQGQVNEAPKATKVADTACEMCHRIIVGRNANTRFCSSACRSRATSLYKKDPVEYARFGPRYERPDIKAKHAETRHLKATGAIPRNAHPLSSARLEDPVELMWTIISVDAEAITAAKQDREAEAACTTPADYLIWRNTQPWAKSTELTKRLSELTNVPVQTPAGFQCTCIACDAEFTAPFKADLCQRCL